MLASISLRIFQEPLDAPMVVETVIAMKIMGGVTCAIMV